MNISMIMVPIDFTDCATSGFLYAVEMARLWKAEIVLAHVIDSNNTQRIADYMKEPVEKVKDRMQNQAKQSFRRFLTQFKELDVEVKETIVSYGRPFQEIAVKARDLQADMIVMGGYGSMGRGMIDEIFFGSTVEKVIRLLPCPVVCVPVGWEASIASEK